MPIARALLTRPALSAPCPNLGFSTVHTATRTLPRLPNGSTLAQTTVVGLVSYMMSAQSYIARRWRTVTAAVTPAQVPNVAAAESKTKAKEPRPHGSQSPRSGGTNSGATISTNASTNARGARATSAQPIQPVRMQPRTQEVPRSPPPGTRQRTYSRAHSAKATLFQPSRTSVNASMKHGHGLAQASESLAVRVYVGALAQPTLSPSETQRMQRYPSWDL